ncbi:MAG: hypothetical protein P1V81_16545, partial [Planctomycetota bacterium]|nr:hypothetical protein [Planctomycetota bacterium]
MSDSTFKPFVWPLVRLVLFVAVFFAALYLNTRDEPEPAEAETAVGVALEDANPNIAASALGPSAAQDGAGWSAVVLGPARGHLEPCGCSGGQLGGVDRLASVLAATARTASGMA